MNENDSHSWRRLRSWVIVLVLLAPGAACGSGTSSGQSAPGGPTKVAAVAAEDTWGSLLAQVGGDRVDVTSIIRDPAVDAHDYEAKPSDGVAVAEARLVVVNGTGYDDWASKLVAASPSSQRVVVDVGEVVGAKRGDNPHRWYVPDDVHRVIGAMTAALRQVAPDHAAHFDARAARLETDGLKAYDETLARIRTAHAGTPIAVTESVFEGMADALGLRVLTPPSFAEAMAEGGEPTARDKEEVDRQISEKQVKVLVYNSQNATPDVRALADAARARAIPVTTVTESLSPHGATFQDWQVRQLLELEAALSAAQRQ